MRRRLAASAALLALIGSVVGLMASPASGQVPPDDTQSWGELIEDGAEVGAFAPGQTGSGGGGGGNSNISCELHQVSTSGGLGPAIPYSELERQYAISNAPIPVVRTCMELPATVLPEQRYDWTPAEGNPISPEALAEMARARLRVPTPSGDVSPSVGVGTQAQMDTYFWLDNWPVGGAEPSASASAGGVTVTATATPVSHTWWIRDSVRGTFPVRCGAGPGAAYSGSGAPPAGACVWTPQHSSAGQSSTHSVTGEPCFAATVTVVWNVTWSGGNLGNLATHANTCIVVHEIQAVVSGS